MPLSRIRVGEDTIERLGKAANLRYREAVHLADGGHHLASIYLAGYAIEMTLGASYFGMLPGYGSGTIIVLSERRNVLNSSRLLSQVEDKSHPIDGLARFLIQEKPTFNPPGFEKKFAETLLTRVDEVCQYWAPRLRYRSVEATATQSKSVLRAVSWIMENLPIC